MKKFSALFVALAMLFALATTAFAAGSGSITIENATIGKNYYAYKLFDLSYDGSSYAYSIQSSDQFYAEVSTLGSPFTVDSAGNVTVNSGENAATISAWWASLDTSAKVADASKEPADAETFAWTGLDEGYYFVTTNNGTVVTITSTDLAVTVIDKNQTPDLTDDPETTETETGKSVYDDVENKWVAKNTAAIGDTVQFKIDAFIPAYDGDQEITSYTFTDTLDDGFTPPTDSDVDVVIYNWDPVNTPTPVSITHDCNPTVTVSGQVITVTLTDVDACAQGHANAHIRITYSAKLNKEAVYDNKNTVVMDWRYKSAPTTPHTDTEITHTYTYQINVQKYKDSAAPSNKLPGARFSLYDNPSGTKIPVVSTGAGQYRLAESDSETGAVTEMDTDASGALSIAGLDGKTYYLEETVAPVGYNKLTELVPLSAVATGDTNDDGVIDTPVDILNHTGTPLPETGGVGTTLFITFGSLALLLSGIFLVTNKRMKKEFY